MAIKIRLARGGSKKRPFYRIVAADSRMPRDGRFIERLGTYNPLLAKDSEERVKMDIERVQHWLSHGAQPTDRIRRMLEAAGALEATTRSNPKAAVPGEKAAKRAEEKVAKAAAATEAAAVPAPAPEPVVEAAAEPVAEAAEEAAPEVTEEVGPEATEEAAPEAPAEATDEEAAKAPEKAATE